METIGSGAVTAPFTAVKDSDVIIVIGANPTENHPVAATYFKQAAKRGADAHRDGSARPGADAPRHATCCSSRTAADVALLNAMMNVIVTEGLYDRQYIQAHTEGFEQLKTHLAKFSPEAMAAVCGIAPEVIRTVARSYAKAKAAIIFWGMGVSQHAHGTDNARCLISLALMCGQVGRAGTGLHPLRGQNNVQGASDAGLIPMMFPDYARVGVRTTTASPRKTMGSEARSRAGADGGRDRGCDPSRRDQGHVHHGRKPGHVGSRREPCARGSRQARTSGGAGHLPHRDGDVCRCDPAGERMAGEGRHRVEHQPARCRWAARRSSRREKPSPTGGSPSRSPSAWGCRGPMRGPAEVFAEMKLAMPSLDNITWERLMQGIGGHLSLPGTRSSGRRDRVRRPFPDSRWARQVRARRRSSRPTNCRTGTILIFYRPAGSSNIGTPAP